MSKFSGYRCSVCQTQYQPGGVTYTCPHDGGDLDVILDYDGLKNRNQPEDITSRTDTFIMEIYPAAARL